jgi:hypothetical protein
VDADALLSTGKVRSRLDPAVTAKKGIERHHLFPRAYLRKTKITGTKQINQIANMALVEWNDNIAISDQPPAIYWPDQVAKKALHQSVLTEQVRWHALPERWTELPYEEFLVKRRKLMAQVVRTAFGRLADQQYAPVYPTAGAPQAAPATSRAHYAVRVIDLLDAGLIAAGAILINPNDDVQAAVLSDGRIEFDGVTYDSPSGAGDAAHGGSTNGWGYWLADTPSGLRPLAGLREGLRADENGGAESEV